MKFSELPYKRPDFDAYSKEMHELLLQLKSSNNVDDFMEVFSKINDKRNHLTTMMSIASVRHSIDTNDKFYDAENNYWDENGPNYQVFDTQLYKIVLESALLEQLKTRIYPTFFKVAEYTLKSFDEKIIPQLQEENRLVSEYNKLIASAQIEFDGKIYNVSQLSAICLSDDRNIRKAASLAKMNWFASKEAEIDEIYDKLVKLRDSIAKALGYQNYIELGYIRMCRFDYDENMVAKFREQVIQHIVPAANELYKRQLDRLELNDGLHFYDEKYEFKSGNPKPRGNKNELVAKANIMYSEMSKETKEFFDVMVSDELLDLEAKSGKQGGGYCTSFNEYKLPFIFSNFNGTSGDVDVLTHEAGHAFQVYTSFKNIDIPECLWPTYESCEIHSMSMEFFAWPWMKLFFEDDTDKYYFLHLSSAIKFIPYGVLIDHFQHEVYRNPNLTKDERKAIYRKLEKLYLPHKDYQGCDLLEKGCWWYQQAHIFNTPFYYIDYTLAQICALQFWNRNYLKDVKAWDDYVKLCQLGGSQSFVNLVKSANLISPFEQGCVDEVIHNISQYLKQIDDRSL